MHKHGFQSFLFSYFVFIADPINFTRYRSASLHHRTTPTLTDSTTQLPHLETRQEQLYLSFPRPAQRDSCPLEGHGTRVTAVG